MSDPCEKEKQELDEAKKALQDHTADPLNRREENPESFDRRTQELQQNVEQKKEALTNCEEGD